MSRIWNCWYVSVSVIRSGATSLLWICRQWCWSLCASLGMDADSWHDPYDINMPEMDGLTLLVKIKEQFAHHKAVVVSAYGDMENIRTAMNRGAFWFYHKANRLWRSWNDHQQNHFWNTADPTGAGCQERLAQTIMEKEVAELDRQKAEQSEKFKQQFLANMSHEIRTPMNSIIGLTNLLVKTNLDQQQAKYLNVIKKSSENLLVIINDILDLSKIEAGKMVFEQTPFLVADALETVYHTLLFKADEKKLVLKSTSTKAFPLRFPVTLYDWIRSWSILPGMPKFTEKDPSPFRDRAEQKRQSKHTRVFYPWYRIGIAPEGLNKIFESFLKRVMTQRANSEEQVSVLQFLNSWSNCRRKYLCCQWIGKRNYI